jgi:hypothetical protein
MNMSKALVFGIFTLLLVNHVPVFASDFSNCIAILKAHSWTGVMAAHDCKTAGPGFISCYTVAKNNNLAKASTVRACINAGPEFSTCYDDTIPRGGSVEAAIDRCGQKRIEPLPTVRIYGADDYN